jgi:magnesium transporter
MTVREAIDYTQQCAAKEGIRYPYVLDESEKLVGVVPLHSLLFSKHDVTIGSVMNANVVSVTADTDQEDVGRLVRDYDLFAVPVTDARGRLVGVVTVDDVIEAREEEVSEDMYRLAGTAERDPLHGPLARKLWLRLPWVVLTLLGGLLICTVVRAFEDSISKTVALAAFLPLIPLMGGNVAIQASTIVVRGLALGRIHRGTGVRLVFRELGVAVALGAVCGAIVAAIVTMMYGQVNLSLVVGVALFTAVSCAAVLGAAVPLLFNAANVDPALAAGPLVTIMNDLISVGVYLALSTLLLATID